MKKESQHEIQRAELKTEDSLTRCASLLDLVLAVGLTLTVLALTSLLVICCGMRKADNKN